MPALSSSFKIPESVLVVIYTPQLDVLLIERVAHEHGAWQWLPYRQAAETCYSPSNAEAILLLPRFLP